MPDEPTLVQPGLADRTALRDVSAATYHADELGDQPTLSASIAKILLNQSPAHAWTCHPRLNPNFEKPAESKFDVGTVVHALFFEGQAAVEVVAADDWRTKDAKEARDVARDNGRIPLLVKDWERVQEIVERITLQLVDHEAQPPLFSEGKAEQTITWTDNGVACRARLDWLRDDHTVVEDLKTTTRSANPATWSRQLFSLDYDIQAAMYRRAVFAATGATPDYRLIVIETEPPYALQVLELSPAALDLANDKVDRALEIWKRCLENDDWPAYPARVATVEPPTWAESQWLERELREETLA